MTLLRAVWAEQTWTGTAHVAAGLPLGLAGAFLMIFLGTVTLGLAVLWIAGIASLWILLGCVHGLTAAQRLRFEAFLGVVLPVAPAGPVAGGWHRRVLARARTSAFRRQFCYHLLSGPLSLVSLAVVAVGWAAGAILTTLPAYGWALPSDGPFGGIDAPRIVALTIGGVGCLLLTPWLVRSAVAVDLAAARALLGTSRVEEMASQVRTLAESREAAVEAAAAERRRIERDLHDGTQQRLTALAMNLGIARKALADQPGPAQDVIEQAHAEAKQALAELRGFVRGLHPVVLDDRGLADALPGIVARSPVPVTLEIDIARRPAPAVEAVAYFVVSEALTNVVKHAEATSVDITVCRRGDRLLIGVRDDGQGGASPGGGTGLVGLGHRVQSVQGTLQVDSPTGGPTMISVELPCEP
jgi:signal transduction histidine kinase